ncbi:MAG: hypothetical protein HYT76_06450 [Deltaproteobacteria bacterium]|nr:hypothetical protein [Deltaproteobacteria bacterium]
MLRRLPILLLVLFSGFLIPERDASAPPPVISNPSRGMQQRMRETTVDSPSPASTRYNQRPGLQFEIKPIGPPNGPALNYGIGNGTSDAYFCSGTDEAIAYKQLTGLPLGDANPNNRNGSNEGTYQFYLINDRCQSEGVCGEILASDTCYVVGVPTHATNCHQWGAKKVWDDTIYQENPVVSTSDPTPPRESGHEGWQGRNFIDDNHGFLFSRYLMQPITCSSWLHDYDSPSASASPGIGFGMRVESADRNHEYGARNPGHPSLDIPHSKQHLKWGFTCGVIAGQNGYKSPLFHQGLPSAPTPYTMEDERKDHYKTLLALARNGLAEKIASGALGDLHNASLDTNQKETREIVVTIWNILGTMLDRIPGDCAAGQGCSQLRFWAEAFQGNVVQMKCCQTAEGSLIEFQPEEERICLSHEICGDCQSKRAMGSHPFYNIGPKETGDACRPSYGIMGASTDGGLFESLYGTDRGYEIIVEESTEVVEPTSGSSGGGKSGYLIERPRDFPIIEEHLRSRTGGRVPSNGYSPVIVSLLAHQLVHAYYLEKFDRNRLHDWPLSPESIDEEEIAVITQALVYDQLCELGYCPNEFAMQKKEFIRSVTETGGEVTAMTAGMRFSYPNVCRGYNETYLGSFCANMFNISRTLSVEQNPTYARMLAGWHALGPTLGHPRLMTLNGVEREFALPLAGSGGGFVTPQESSRDSRSLDTTPSDLMQRMREIEPVPPAMTPGRSAPIVNPAVPQRMPQDPAGRGGMRR